MTTNFGCRILLISAAIGALACGGLLIAAAEPDPPAPPETRNRNSPAPTTKTLVRTPTNRQTTRPADNNASNVAPVTGHVAAFDPGKSITIEIRRRGGMPEQREYVVDEGYSIIELRPGAKSVAVGMPATVWLDKDDAQRVARIIVGQNNNPRRAANRNLNQPPTMMARVETSPAAFVVPEKPLRPAVRGLSPQDVADEVDRQIDARLAVANIAVAPPCDDAEFLRRVYLDITGIIPPVDAVEKFLDDRDPKKRAKLIDELLAGPAYGNHFADLWCDRINVKDLPIYREPFVDWLSRELNVGRGWDEVVYDMLTAEGTFHFITRGKRLGSADPRALFMLLNTEDVQGAGKPNPAWLTAESGRLFLGVQLQCAECHDHPFTETWEQSDFWGLAAFFGKVGSARGPGNAGLRWTETAATANEPVSIVIPAGALKSGRVEVSAAEFCRLQFEGSARSGFYGLSRAGTQGNDSGKP